MNIFLNKKNFPAFTLVEIMVSLLVAMILVFGIYSLVVYSLHITADNKAYVEALEIANQKMEQIRNLAYEDVGTEFGSPHGVILDYEYNIRNKYTVYTTVQFYDDPYDGTLEGDTDDIFIDYKIATVRVFWEGNFGEKRVTLFSKVIPITEETLEGYGLLKIIVVDANADPIANANIHIENNSLDPIMSADYVSNNEGILSLAVLPEFESYEITVTKEGMGIDKTYDRDEINLDPSKEHLSVNEGLKTEELFSIDYLSNLTIKAIDQQLSDNWQVNTDDSTEIQIDASLAIDSDNNIYIVWEDFRSASASKIYVQKYNSTGEQQWTPDDIVIATANNQVNPDILVDGEDNLYISWNDDSLGNQDVYLVKLNSSDGSNIWGGSKKLNTLAGNDDQRNSKLGLFSTGTSTVIIWQDNRSGDEDLYMQKYDEDGNQVWPVEIRINTNLLGDGLDQSNPEVSIDSNNNIYIVWQDNRDGNYNIYAQKYNSAGLALWAQDIKINTNSGTSDQYSPSGVVDTSGNFYIAWTDERDGNKNIYAQKYNSTGTILWEEDLRINISMDEFDQYDVEIIINPNTDLPMATWTDSRNGNDDIFVSEFNYYENPTYLGSIPIHLVGTKQIGDNPVIYEYDQDYITDANGLVQIELEWDTGYTLTLPESYENYEIYFTSLAQPFEILPNTTQEILLYLRP